MHTGIRNGRENGPFPGSHDTFVRPVSKNSTLERVGLKGEEEPFAANTITFVLSVRGAGPGREDARENEIVTRSECVTEANGTKNQTGQISS